MQGSTQGKDKTQHEGAEGEKRDATPDLLLKYSDATFDLLLKYSNATLATYK